MLAIDKDPKVKRPHSRNLRKGRFSEPGRIYLVTVGTHRRIPIFHDWQAGRILIHEMKAAQDAGWVESMAWVVMPDHFHWLLALRSASLPRLIQRVKSRSAIRINKHSGLQGRVWQPGYHDHAMRGEEDLPEIARYVVANPLRSRLVEKIGDYPLWDAVWH